MLPQKGKRKLKQRVYINKRFIRYLYSLLKIFVFVFIIFISLFLFINNGYLEISNVKINIKEQNLLIKNDIYNTVQQSIKNNTSFIPNKTMYIFKRDLFENILKLEYPEIEKIKTKWRPWDDFLVSITERTPKYIYCVFEKCDVIDGNAVKYINDYGANLIRIEGESNFSIGERVINEKDYNFINNITEFLLKRKLKIKTIIISTDAPLIMRIVFDLENGPELIFSSYNNIYEASRSISIALFDIFGLQNTTTSFNISDLEYLDFRFENKIIYK